jgi:APA family basic amino acid/polyamine antiporter
MGEPSKLKGRLGFGAVVVIVIANIIGSGVYKKVAPMAAELHSSVWILFCWVLGGVITLFGALSNAEVAGLLADTGGEYVYYKKIYNRFFAFIYGWSLFTIIQTAAISSLAYVFAQSVGGMIHLPAVLPGWKDVNIAGVFYPFADLNIKLIALLLIIFFTVVNSFGVRVGARFSKIILLLVFTGLLVIVLFGLTSSHAHITQAFTLHTDPAWPIRFSSVFTAMLAAFWAYQGWAAIGFMGGEIHDAKRMIPRGIAVGVLLVIASYLLVNTTYLSLLSIPELTRIADRHNTIAAIEATKVFWGNAGGIFLSVLIAVTTLSCTHATILASCRTYYAMALEGLFFRPAAKLNKAEVPANSLFYQGAWACVLVLSGTFDQLTDMIIFAVFIYYGSTTLGVFILRKKMPDAPRPYKVWGYPVVPAIFILFCLALFFNTLVTRPREAIIGVVLILSGVPFYFRFIRRVLL